MAVELYHFWSSVCSVRCRMALEEKGVPWESRYVDLFKFDQLAPDYLAINPGGVVPTLVHDGEPIRESTIINEYIDNAFDGPSLVPADPVRAARMREFVHACEDDFPAIATMTFVKYVLPKLRNRWGDEELLKQVDRRPLKFYRDLHRRAIQGQIGPAEVAEAEQTVQDLLDRLETTLEGRDWIVGDFSLADIAVAPYMFRLAALGKNLFWSADNRRHVHEWYERLSRRPAFVTAVSWPDESGGGYEEVGLSGGLQS